MWTRLSYTAPGTPADVQQAVVTKLGLPATAPTAFVARTCLAAESPGRLQVAFGNRMQSQFSGVATFVAAPGSGTTGSWEVGRWTTHDGVIDAMVTVRTGIADAVEATGGSTSVRLVPQAERTRR